MNPFVNTQLILPEKYIIMQECNLVTYNKRHFTSRSHIKKFEVSMRPKYKDMFFMDVKLVAMTTELKRKE